MYTEKIAYILSSVPLPDFSLKIFREQAEDISFNTLISR